MKQGRDTTQEERIRIVSDRGFQYTSRTFHHKLHAGWNGAKYVPRGTLH